MKTEKKYLIGSLVVVLALGALTSLRAADEPVKADPAPIPVTAANDPAPYRISGGETVRLIVPATVGESLVETIYDDGLVSLPTGSVVNVRGKTLVEAQNLINKK